uniref:Uncharacterized protein n=1 Tax=Panagrolaimus sp. PS1159 TaxID=55785 RepID=A0AC35EY17_9BILA
MEPTIHESQNASMPSYNTFHRTPTTSTSSSENNYYLQGIDEEAQEAINIDEEHHQNKVEKLASFIIKNIGYFSQF